MVHRRHFAGSRAHGSAGREGQDGPERGLRTRRQPKAGGRARVVGESRRTASFVVTRGVWRAREPDALHQKEQLQEGLTKLLRAPQRPPPRSDLLECHAHRVGLARGRYFRTTRGAAERVLVRALGPATGRCCGLLRARAHRRVFASTASIPAASTIKSTGCRVFPAPRAIGPANGADLRERY